MKNIISIIVIVGSLLSFVFIVKPQYTEIKKLEAKSDDLERVLINARKLQSLRDELLAKRKKLSNRDIKKLEKLIPESADNVKLIIEFENIADKYGLVIQTASTKKGDGIMSKKGGSKTSQNFDIETRDYGVISLDFDITGGYSEFISFLSDIESNIRVTDLRNLSINPDEKGLYTFTVTIETYWLKDNI